MQLASLFVAVAASAFAALARADNEPLPWDGRGQDLTVSTLTDKYLTHILTQRQNGTADPADWVTIDQTGRSSFNDDTGVINIAVDQYAIFGGQTNFRRSELVQNIESGSSGTTFFRFSFMKEKAYNNKYSWQCVFPESHSFEVRIDASVDPPMVIWYTGGSLDVKWETELVLGTWYNFGVAVTNSDMTLYTSTGQDGLALTKTATTASSVTSYEFHIGQLTLSNDGSAVAMVSGVQDILAFNGVSVEDGIPSDVSSAGSAGSTTTTTTSTSGSDSDATTAPATTTAAPTATTAAPATTTAAPAATTAAPAATTAAPVASSTASTDASESDEDSSADDEADSDADEADSTTAPATDDSTTTTEAPATTTSAPTSSSCKTRVRRH